MEELDRNNIEDEDNWGPEAERMVAAMTLNLAEASTGRVFDESGEDITDDLRNLVDETA